MAHKSRASSRLSLIHTSPTVSSSYIITNSLSLSPCSLTQPIPYFGKASHSDRLLYEAFINQIICHVYERLESRRKKGRNNLEFFRCLAANRAFLFASHGSAFVLISVEMSRQCIVCIHASRFHVPAANALISPERIYTSLGFCWRFSYRARGIAHYADYENVISSAMYSLSSL